MDCSPPDSFHPWNFLGKSTGVGCHFLLQGIFWSGDWTLVSRISGFIIWATRESHQMPTLSYFGMTKFNFRHCSTRSFTVFFSESKVHFCNGLFERIHIFICQLLNGCFMPIYVKGACLEWWWARACLISVSRAWLSKTVDISHMWL